jgi:hypothetical protein
MTRLILAVSGLFLSLPTAALAQVKIRIPAEHYKVGQEIHAEVENKGSYPVTVCLEFLPESTISPFEIQRYENGKWGTLLLAIDIAGSVATVLEPGRSYDFPFRLNDPGRMRLRLEYWRGSIPNFHCNAVPKGSKLATSAIFADQ